MRTALLAIIALLALGCNPSPTPKTDTAPSGKTRSSRDGFEFEVPTDWKASTPASAMRKGQWSVLDRDAVEGEATCVYFGIMGGSVDQNIDRWKAQFSGVSGEPKVEEFTSGGMTITVLDISGEYASDMGSEPSADQRMLGAIVATPDGNQFFKLFGPRGTVGDWRDAFIEMLKKARFKGA